MDEQKVDFVYEAERLIELFKELEEVVREKAKRAGIFVDRASLDYLIKELSGKSRVVAKYKDEIITIKEIRNINTHHRGNNFKYVACPSPEVNDRLRFIIDEIANPPTAYASKMCVKRENICFRTFDDTIDDTIAEMVERRFSHIPIMENGKLVGVFSEGTLLDIVNVKNAMVMDETTKFEAIRDAIKTENHAVEEFTFISRKTDIYEVEDLFKDYFERKDRLGCIFITENGKEDEEILGMITAWDVLGKG